MTEAEWRACEDPSSLLEFIEGKASDRKLRLFICACCRRVWHLLDRRPSRVAIDIAEAYANGTITRDRLNRAWAAALKASQSIANEQGQGKTFSAAELAQLVCWNPKSAAYQASRAAVGILGENESEMHIAFLGDIFGNLFRPLSLDLAWRTSTVALLTQQMYDSRDFSAMPVLADALQDAGCENTDILDHCRGPGPHVRGCWVVDSVLGKE